MPLGTYHFLPGKGGGGGGGLQSLWRWDHNFFCNPEGGRSNFFLVLTKFHKRVCTTHLQHVIEYDSDLL